MTLEDAARQPRQHPRRGRRASAEMLQLRIARSLLNAEFEAMRELYGRHARSRSTAPSIRTAATTRCATALERIRREAEDAVRGGCRARRPDRRAASSADRVGDPDDPGDRRGAYPPGAPAAAHLHLAQRALGRMPRRALFRGADRRRRHHGERLSGRGRRSPTAIAAACSASSTLDDCLDALSRRRSTRACSRSCRRWASR